IKLMKSIISIVLFLIICKASISQTSDSLNINKKWGVELNLLWPIFPGNIYKGQVTYETWRKKELVGDVYLGFHIRPFEYRETEGDFSNLALTFGYRQFLWKGLHLELYQAFGPGFNRTNVIDGKDYDSWDYEIGGMVGYRWEFLKNRNEKKVSPYISTQHGMFYLAAQSNPHPIKDFSGEKPFYVGTLNFGIKF
ncbi:MAG: hypothetical protein WED33_04300, partial [Bacteroidia bacterium]